MKKIISLLLALAMCVSLCACGGNNAPEQTEAPTEATTPPADTATEETGSSETVTVEEAADDVVCCTVTVSVNPEFQLKLNKNGQVLELVCLNDDAANALAGSDVTGMTADEAVAKLLDDIYVYDSTIFETDQPKITVIVTMEEGHEKLEQAIFRIDDQVYAFAETHQIPMGYERRSTPVMDKNSTVISDTIDENGNRVVVEIDSDGIKWTTVSSGETGAVLELIRIDPDGTETHCDMETNTTTTVKPDGTTSQSQGVIGKG